MSDDMEKLLREKARKLATDLMRDPVLALQYRDTVFESYEDSASERKVTQWMTKAGYATRVDLLRDELAHAASTNIAAWDGAYVLRVDGKSLVSLQIDVVGVRINGSRVSGVTFTDGVLRFGPAAGAPWNGELRFTSEAPMSDKPLSDGGTFQRRCAGKLWKKDAARPEVDNVKGATKRIVLPPSPPDSVENMAVSTQRRPLRLGADAPATFVGKWKGDYKVTLVSKDTATGNDLTKDGPDYGIAGEGDKKVKLTYIDPFEVDVTAPGIQPEADHIVYTAGSRQFDLTFGEFGDDVRGFSGKVFPSSATAPDETNVTAVARSPLAPEPGADDARVVDPGLAIAVGTFVAAIGGIIAVIVGVKYADKLTAQREYEKAVARNAGTDIDLARNELMNASDALDNVVLTTRSNLSDIALFGDGPARERWATDRATKIKNDAITLNADIVACDGRINQLNTDILQQKQDLQDATDALQRLKDDVDADADALRDAEDLERQERDALTHLETNLDKERSGREDLKTTRDKLTEDLQKVHELKG